MIENHPSFSKGFFRADTLHADLTNSSGSRQLYHFWVLPLPLNNPQAINPDSLLISSPTRYGEQICNHSYLLMRLKNPWIHSKECISFPFYSTPTSPFATATFYFYVNGCNLSDTTKKISQNTRHYLLSGLFSLVGVGLAFLPLFTKPAILALRIKQLWKAGFDHLALLEFVQNNEECYKRNMLFSLKKPKAVEAVSAGALADNPRYPGFFLSVPSKTRKE